MNKNSPIYNPPTHEDYAEIEITLPGDMISLLKSQFEFIKDTLQIKYLYYDTERSVVELWGNVDAHSRAKEVIQLEIDKIQNEILKPSPPKTNYFKHFNESVNGNINDTHMNNIPKQNKMNIINNDSIYSNYNIYSSDDDVFDIDVEQMCADLCN